MEGGGVKATHSKARRDQRRMTRVSGQRSLWASITYSISYLFYGFPRREGAVVSCLPFKVSSHPLLPPSEDWRISYIRAFRKP